MEFQLSFFHLLFLACGFISTILGIIFFMGRSAWAQQSMRLGRYELNHELIGFVLFFLGIILMLFFLIPALSPRFISPGMS
jgi:hypothetical protein